MPSHSWRLDALVETEPENLGGAGINAVGGARLADPAGARAVPGGRLENDGRRVLRRRRLHHRDPSVLRPKRHVHAHGPCSQDAEAGTRIRHSPIRGASRRNRDAPR
jgi:hypothetical protein